MERGVVPGPHGHFINCDPLIRTQLLLPYEMRSSRVSSTHPSPSRTRDTDPLASSGQIDHILPHHTGVTTIARQFTGLSSGTDGGLTRHMTGGRLSPTKQLGTPMKAAVQFSGGGSKGTMRPRPKSAIGMRGEGRGMLLVQQFTGGGGV